jgi:pSer/pThr/pTyr-binding forkhead associated (FHA) protein
MSNRLLKIRVSLKGRPVNSYTFQQDEVTVGRNPEADIFLDNPGVSRNHVKLEMTTKGMYAAEDLGSANGTFLNDQLIKREFLMNNDVLRVGKYTLWIAYEEDRRGSPDANAKPAPEAYEGTMVLSTEDLERIVDSSREAERSMSAAPETSFSSVEKKEETVAAGTAGSVFPSRAFLSVMIVLAFLLGAAAGSSATRMLLP